MWPLKAKSNIFTLPREPFGVGRDERVVEIPWALSCYRGQQTVLEIGHAHATEVWLDRLRELPAREIHGIDIAEKTVDGIESMVGDARSMPYAGSYFDLVFCISTIEHIGRDNADYCPSHQHLIDDDGDLRTMSEVYRILRRGGEAIVTVPFGQFHDYGWFIHYDQARWTRMLSGTGLKVVREDFFRYAKGWFACDPIQLENTLYQQDDAPAAAGLACCLLRK